MQVRGTVAEERMNLDSAIGKNTTEGRTHMMCIEGTEGQHTLLNSQVVVHLKLKFIMHKYVFTTCLYEPTSIFILE